MGNTECLFMKKNREGGARPLACALAVIAMSPALLEAKDAIPNLGGGLEQFAAPATLAKRSARSASSLINTVQLDDAGRALVKVTLDGKTAPATILQSL